MVAMSLALNQYGIKGQRHGREYSHFGMYKLDDLINTAQQK